MRHGRAPPGAHARAAWLLCMWAGRQSSFVHKFSSQLLEDSVDMSRGFRHSTERLANILNSSPYPGQAEQLKECLLDCESKGFPVVQLINYNIPRYNGRTLIHIAANNGLFECLKELLKLGGKLYRYLQFIFCYYTTLLLSFYSIVAMFMSCLACSIVVTYHPQQSFTIIIMLVWNCPYIQVCLIYINFHHTAWSINIRNTA